MTTPAKYFGYVTVTLRRKIRILDVIELPPAQWLALEQRGITPSELPFPRGVELWSDRHESEYRLSDPGCDAVCREITDALLAAGSGVVRTRGSRIIYDFTDHPALEQRWNDALDQGRSTWHARLPPLPVKVGDFIAVDGCVMRVSSVDLERRTVATQRLDHEGRRRSEIPGVKGDGLTPISPPVDVTAGWAPSQGGGLEGARAAIRVHQAVLERAGLVPPDDD